MANSIYDYTGFYKQAKIIAENKEVKTYTNREMLQKLYAADSVFLSRANRGSGNSTEIANAETILIDKKAADSTEYQLWLSRFKNLPDIQFAKNKIYHDNAMGIANNLNAQSSDFGAVDAEWISSRFMTGSEHLSKLDRNNRFFSNTGWKFESTKWGQHMAINPRPQFTRTCDIKGNNKNSSVIGDSIYNTSNSKYGIDILPPGETRDNMDFGLGMGRYYSEAIDDNATQIYMQFGLPKFNSLISFFINAVSYEDSYIANYGRLPTAYTIGSVVSGFVLWCAFPLITTTIFLLKRVFQFFFSHPFNYYYMEPNMHLYWTSVNLIVNQLAAELGLMAPILKADTDPKTGESAKTQMGVPVRLSSADIKELSRYMPNLFNETTGYIDIFHLATRSQSLANYLNKKEYEIYKTRDSNGGVKEEIAGWYGNGTTYFQKTKIAIGDFAKLDKQLYLSDWLRMLLKPNTSDANSDLVKELWASSNTETAVEQNSSGRFMSFQHDESNKQRSRDSIIERYTKKCENLKFKDGEKPNMTTTATTVEKSEAYTKLETNEEKLDYLESQLQNTINQKLQKQETNRDASEESKTKSSSWTDKISGMFMSAADGLSDYALKGADTFDVAVREGGAYAIFNVDYTGSTSESWSNSVGEIETAGLTKSVAKAARDIRFNLTGGLLSTAIGQVVDGLKNFAMASIDQFSFGLSNVVASLLGGGYADIPKRWDDSDFSFPKINYTIQLVAPYGNPISQLQNIYIPLAMIMAGSLPLQAGKSSYTSPLLCSIFNKGVQDVRLGMITDVSINRGITNMPFSRNKRMLSCEVSFSVTDFSTRLVAPINSSPFKTLFSLNWDDDTPTGIYIATLASRDLFTNKYILPRTKQKLARMMMAFSQAASPNSFAFRFSQPGTIAHGISYLWAPDRRYPLNQRNNL